MTTAALVPVEQAAISTSVDCAVDVVKSIEVVDASSCNTMVETLRTIKTVIKSVEDYYSPRKAGAHQVWKGYCDDEGRFLKPLKEAEKTGKLAIAKYHEEQERKNRAAATKIEAMTGIAAVTIVQPQMNSATTKKLYRWKVVNASLIPREFLKPDDDKIHGMVEVLKDATNIPGIEVFTETSVTIRR